MDKYNIMIIGDNILEGTMELTLDEITAFCKIINALEPDGGWVPQIIVRNISEEQRLAKEEQQLAKETEEINRQRFVEECSHLGKYSIQDKYPDLLKMFT